MKRAGTRAGIAMLLVGGLFMALPGAAVVALPACDIPGKTCFGERINALTATDGGGADPTCTTCVQAACCDEVGFCQDDPICRESFKTAHSCVIANGPGEESRCTTNLTPPARALYSCMRKSCGGATCRVPNCDVDRAAGLIVSAECDRCMGGACCEKLNTCYGDRRCKLILECIIDKCRQTVGDSMTELGLIPQAVRDQLHDDVCGGRERPGGPAPDCITACIDDFAPVGANGTADDKGARCRAFEVYACGAEGNCGPKCVLRPDAGADAGAAAIGDASADGDASDASTD
jgi:hypothetical protein